jgi:hypothetical protein
MLAPRPVRRAAVSAVILFHFAGILSAVTSPPATPYLTSQMWTRVFRPYLQFTYLNNAYHFYSPEPGPANHLWFFVTFNDGRKPLWFDMPQRPADIKDPLALEYYRRLALTEQINQLMPVGSVNPPASRNNARGARGEEIRSHPDLVPALQYRPPNEMTRNHVIPSFVRYAAYMLSDSQPERVASIRLYRVEHRIIMPHELLQHVNPYDPTLYRPYYQGEFTADGKLKNPEDPMLYWVVPIVRELKKGIPLRPDGLPANPDVIADQGNFEYKSYLAVQTGNDQSPADEMIRAIQKVSAR